MKALVNSILPYEALENLSRFAEPVPFSTRGIVPEPLAGHVDIFCTKVDGKMVLAPNTPKHVVEIMEKAGMDLVFGNTEVTGETETMWAYNVMVDEKFCVCNADFIDPVLKEMFSERKTVHVRQGFARCSAVSLGGAVMTSDGGIAKALDDNNIQNILISQEGITLPGYRNGCFGGACGVCGDKVFIAGNLRHHKQGREIRDFIGKNGFMAVELSDSPLLDVGSMIFF